MRWQEIYGCTTKARIRSIATEDDGSVCGGCIIPSPVLLQLRSRCGLLDHQCADPPCESTAGSQHLEVDHEFFGSFSLTSTLLQRKKTVLASTPLAWVVRMLMRVTTTRMLYNDGSCEYASCAVGGCDNPNACNFNLIRHSTMVHWNTLRWVARMRMLELRPNSNGG